MKTVRTAQDYINKLRNWPRENWSEEVFAYKGDNFTDAGIKDALLAKFKAQKLSQKDVSLLSNFGHDFKKDALTGEIYFKVKKDAFRQVAIFLDGNTETPTKKIFEVAAIVIGFYPRPLENFLKEEGSHEEKVSSILEEKKIETKEFLPKSKGSYQESEEKENSKSYIGEPINSLQEKVTLKTIVNVLSVIFILVSVFGLFWVLNSTKEKSKVETCYAWMGDEYQIVPCNSRFLDQKGIQVHINNGEINYPNFKKINPTSETQFYSEEGEPLIWYTQNESGRFEFFNQSGKHPINGNMLEKVPLTIVETYKKTESTFPFINNHVKNTSSNEVATLSIIDQDWSNSLQTKLDILIKESGFFKSNLFLKEQFTPDIKNNVLQKKLVVFGDLIPYVDEVWVFIGKSTLRENNRSSGLITCNLEVTLSKYNCKDKIFKEETTFKSIGAGFSDETALNNAILKLTL
ncbi:MAG: hypothetical protein R2776_07060 [Flavobacteriaceae bacterium]|nr:hypothetical protein [Flavobacteriaceae bacterium]